MSVFRTAVISTGGTIEKTYDEFAGAMENTVSVLDIMLARLELNSTEITRIPVMNKDSRDMSPDDHVLIARTAGEAAETHDGVVVVHGTDRLQNTGEAMCEQLGTPSVPIVLMGAMRPYELRNTDALQNLAEALLAVKLLPPGIYVVMHSQVLAFPGIVKDVGNMRFIKPSSEPR